MSKLRPGLRKAWARLRGGELTPKRAALSVGIGIAIGLVPVYGAHWAIVLAVCMPLKLDAPIAYLAANISNPFFAPFLLLAEVQTGSLVMTGASLPFTKEAIYARGPLAFLGQTIVGVLVVAPVAAVVVGMLTFAIASLFRRKRAHDGT